LGTKSASPYNLFGIQQGQLKDRIASQLLQRLQAASEYRTNSPLVIDVVGAPNVSANPAKSTVFGEQGLGSWIPGDNQMCLATWPYNGFNSNMIDGTCALSNSADSNANPAVMTVDSLDDTVHTLSDFLTFSKVFLTHDVGTLSASLTSWYPQAAGWIDLAKGRLPTLVNNLDSWNTTMKDWINADYINNNAWCLPAEVTLLNVKLPQKKIPISIMHHGELS